MGAEGHTVRAMCPFLIWELFTWVFALLLFFARPYVIYTLMDVLCITIQKSTLIEKKCFWDLKRNICGKLGARLYRTFLAVLRVFVFILKVPER